jgi:methionine biosynthesis protein MetW
MSATTLPALRPDLALICDWIKPGARILDLACGDGNLLAHLALSHDVRGYGLEIDPANVAECVARGVNVIQADLDDGLRDFETGSFDYVVMTQALQALQRPDQALAEILRVGRTGIVTFPNFGHWRVRTQLMFRGKMPKTDNLPDRWYQTPNIHLCTIKDFLDLCRDAGAKVERVVALNASGTKLGVSMPLFMQNLFGEQAVFLLSR